MGRPKPLSRSGSEIFVQRFPFCNYISSSKYLNIAHKSYVESREQSRSPSFLGHMQDIHHLGMTCE